MRCGGPHPDRATPSSGRHPYLSVGWFGTYHLLPTCRQPPGHLALSRANVDHASATGQQVDVHRKNRVFVPSIGPVGKPLLSPAGMALPDFERITH